MKIFDEGTMNVIEMAMPSNSPGFVKISGSHNCVDISHFPGNVEVTIVGDNSKVTIGKMRRVGKVRITCKEGGSVLLGPHSTAEDLYILAVGANVTIGEDCMISFNVSIRTTDAHGIYNLKSGELINKNEDIWIADHVWIGQGVIVAKGTSIGMHSVIGTNSYLHGATIAKNSLVAGTPARVLREGIIWDRRMTENIYKNGAVTDSLFSKYITAGQAAGKASEVGAIPDKRQECCDAIQQASAKPAFKHLRDKAQPCDALKMYERVEAVKGFFNADDALHFALVLGMQRACGIRGDILEIGTYFGRSTGFLANFVTNEERLVVCDAFQAETTDRYPDKPSIPALLQSISRAAPTFDLNSLVIHTCLSRDLRLTPLEKFRCVHVNGGHGHDEALANLNLIIDHVIPGGIIIVDDYLHANWPGVTSAVEHFLQSRSDVSSVASCNRAGAVGQKLYLMKKIV
jgi:acetyltransferase-like isoleucine patch superfamily enzyme